MSLLSDCRISSRNVKTSEVGQAKMTLSKGDGGRQRQLMGLNLAMFHAGLILC